MKKILYVLILLIIISFSCEKKKVPKPLPPGPYLAPHSLFFLIQRDGKRLPGSVLDNLDLIYTTGREEKQVKDFQRATEEGRDLGIMTTRNIGILSSREKIKTYYLEYPDGDIDTLYVDYDYFSRPDADTTKCYCLFPLREVKFNGEKAYRDSSIQVQRVFLFKKD